MIRTLLPSLVGLGVFSFLSGPAMAFDHLQCFKIKDDATKAQYTADVVPTDPAFANVAPGCSIKVPAKLLCVDAAKTSVQPPPPGAPAGVPLQKFLCYKTKCPKLVVSAALTDQFAAHNVTTKVAGLLCAPVAAPCVDADSDTYCDDLDCNDGDASINPGSAEVCDGVDDDCDGTPDDGNPGGGSPCNTGMSGECATGTTSCQSGALVCNQNVSATPETCDGLDNDCNGVADDGDPGGGSFCNTGIPGQCAAGTTSCQAGALVCDQNVSAAPETCDDFDNDCDGVVDNGNPDGGSPCNTGMLGVCSAGTMNCQSGVLICSPNQSSSPETCDGLDNDCNGAADDGDPGGGAFCNTGMPGQCAAGTTSCQAGALVCDQNVSATPETCDDLDNDCDGVVDNGNPDGGSPCNTGMLGVCSAGTMNCQSGVLICSPNQSSSPEVCDGLDNDCNGAVDDGVCP